MRNAMRRRMREYDHPRTNILGDVPGLALCFGLLCCQFICGESDRHAHAVQQCSCRERRYTGTARRTGTHEQQLKHGHRPQ